MKNNYVITRLVCLLLLACGCSESRKYSTVPLAKVSGIVQAGDSPAARAKISFHPVSPSTQPPLIPSAVTDDEGRFALTTYVKNDGAPLGEYKVTITLPELKDPNAKGMQMPVDRYRGRYADPKKSAWTVTIQDGENSLEPFVLGAK